MPVSVRRAIADDVPLLVSMMKEFYDEGNYALDHREAAQTFSVLLANESYGAIWISENDADTPSGYIVLTVHFSMEHGGLSGFIDDLFVRPSWRRQGASHALLEALLNDCHQRQLVAVQVETGQDNGAAQALYQRSGLTLRGDERLTFVRRLA